MPTEVVLPKPALLPLRRLPLLAHDASNFAASARIFNFSCKSIGAFPTVESAMPD
jgi:hypothetical protein